MKNHDWKRTAWFLLLAAPIVISYFYYDVGGSAPSPNPSYVSSDAPKLTARAKEHLLYGDGSGGGHRHSVGTPCKSEFPSYWDEDKILNTVEMIAANDNLDWRRESNGYDVAESTEDKVRVRVVVDPARNEIVTAYPTNLPRNPCPANDK